MSETNATRAAEIVANYVRTIDPVFPVAVKAITAALDEAERRGRAKASDEIYRLKTFLAGAENSRDDWERLANRLERQLKDWVNQRPAAQPEGER